MLEGRNGVNCSIQTADTWEAEQQGLGLALPAHKYSRTNAPVPPASKKQLVYTSVDCLGKINWLPALLKNTLMKR